MNIPLHPLIVHFPIAFLLAALILHSVHLAKPNWISRVVGVWLVGLSSFFSLLASITGQSELKKTESADYTEEVYSLLHRHELLGNIVTWGSIIFLIGWLFLFFKKIDYRRVDKGVFFIILLLVIAVFIAGYIGGELVWIHRVGV